MYESRAGRSRGEFRPAFLLVPQISRSLTSVVMDDKSVFFFDRSELLVKLAIMVRTLLFVIALGCSVGLANVLFHGIVKWLANGWREFGQNWSGLDAADNSAEKDGARML